MTDSIDAVERLKRIVESDSGGEINDSMRLAQSDVMALLCEFMDVTRLDMRVQPTDEGYRVTITADANAIYGIGKIDSTDSE